MTSEQFLRALPLLAAPDLEEVRRAAARLETVLDRLGVESADVAIAQAEMHGLVILGLIRARPA